MYLIETYPNETETEFISAVEDILIHMWDEPKKDWWHPFEVGELYRHNDRLFRVFECPAGSVSMHIQVKANKGEIDRAILFVGKTLKEENKEEDVAQLIENGKTTSFDPNEIEKIKGIASEVEKKIIYLHLIVTVIALISLLIVGFAPALVLCKYLDTNSPGILFHKFLELMPFGESPTVFDVVIRCFVLVSIVLVGFLLYAAMLLLSLAVPILSLAAILKPFMAREDLKMAFMSFSKLFYFMKGQLFPFIGKTFDRCLLLIIGGDKHDKT